MHIKDQVLTPFEVFMMHGFYSLLISDRSIQNILLYLSTIGIFPYETAQIYLWRVPMSFHFSDAFFSSKDKLCARCLHREQNKRGYKRSIILQAFLIRTIYPKHAYSHLSVFILWKYLIRNNQNNYSKVLYIFKIRNISLYIKLL